LANEARLFSFTFKSKHNAKENTHEATAAHEGNVNNSTLHRVLKESKSEYGDLSSHSKRQLEEEMAKTTVNPLVGTEENKEWASVHEMANTSTSTNTTPYVIEEPHKSDNEHLHIETKEKVTEDPYALIFTIEEILLFSAVICASDAVAALTFISEHTDPKLHSILFGEGVINDAVCICLYSIIREFTVSKASI